MNANTGTNIQTKISSLVSGKQDVDCVSNPINSISIKNPRSLVDDRFNEEVKKDRASNRNLRETITSKISIMMIIELVFISLVLFGIFVVPYLNALSPQITLNLPPVMLTITGVFTVGFIFNTLSKLPTIKFQEKWQVNLASIGKIILAIIVFALVNFMPRKPWVISYEEIHLSPDIIKMILLITETVFVKTTVLAGMIIHGLFKIKKEEF